MADEVDQQIVVELVMKGMAQFTEAVNRANALTATMIASINKLAQQSESTTRSFQGLTIGGVALGTVLGNILVRAINLVTDAFKFLAQASVGAAMSFERTRVAFTSMIGDAQVARSLLSDIAKLSLKSPFEIATLEKAAMQLIGVGDAVENVIHDVTIFGNAAAALNIPIERLIINFGQTIAQGKLTGRELRDFALAGIPLVATLAKNLNTTTAEIFKMVSAGEVGLEDVRAAFESLSAEGGRFHDMMQSQSETTSGRIAVMGNQITILGRTFGSALLPAVNSIISVFQRFIDMIGPDGSLYRPMLALVATIDVIASGFASLANKAATALDNFAPSIESKVFPVIRDALVWGATFSANFAKGIIQGAAIALTAAINFIASMLRYFFAPGSPPRVAPDLDIWGAQAFTEYLRGFSDADFGVLNALQAPIKTALEAIQQIAAMKLAPDDKGGAQALAQATASSYQRISTSISAAIDQARRFGTINQQTLNLVARSTGQFGNEIAKLLELELRLTFATQKVADANDNVTRAQKARADAQKALEGARSAVEKAQDEVDRLQEELFTLHKFDIGGEVTITTAEQLKAAKAQLALLKSSEVTAEGAVDVAQQQEEAAQALLDIEKQKHQVVLDQVNTQKNLVDQLLSMQSMQLDPFKGMAETLKKAGESVAELAEDVANVGDALGDIEFSFEIDPEVYKGIKDSIIGLFKDIEAPFTQAWDDLWGHISKRTVTMPSGNVFEVSTFVPGPLAELKGAVEDFSGAIDTLVNSAAWKSFMELLNFPEGTNIWDKIFGLDWMPADINEFLFGKNVNNDLTASGKEMGIVLGDGIYTGFGDSLGDITWDDFKEPFVNWWNTIKDFFGIKSPSTLAYDLGGNIGQGFLDGLTAKWTSITTWWDTTINAIITTAKNILGIKSPSSVFKTIGNDILQGLWDGLQAKWTSIKTWWDGIATSVISIWEDITGTHSPSTVFADLGQDLMLGLAEGIQRAAKVPVSVGLNVAREVQAASAFANMPFGSQSNITNYNVNANYQERQSPSTIRDDLRLLAQLG